MPLPPPSPHTHMETETGEAISVLSLALGQSLPPGVECWIQREHPYRLWALLDGGINSSGGSGAGW